MRTFVETVKVVNDPAERGVKMIEDFMNTVKDEKQRQELLQVVENNRKKLASFKKSSLIQYVKFK